MIGSNRTGGRGGETARARRACSVPAWVGVVLALLWPACHAAGQTMLAWKWTSGAERRYVIESTMTQSLEFERGRERVRRTITSTQTFNVTERVTEVRDAYERPEAVVERRYTRVRVRGEDRGPDGVDRFEYDSATRPPARPGRPTSTSAVGGADHPMVAPFASLAGKTVTFVVGHDGRVLECRGADEALEGMFAPLAEESTLNPAVSLFSAAVSNETLARQFEAALRIIPGRAMRPGDSWRVEIGQTLPLVGDLRTRVDCRLASVRGAASRQTATIEQRGEMSLEGGQSGAASLGGLFRIHLGSSDLSGSTEFDVSGGYIVSSRQKMTSEWELYVPDFADLERMGEPVRMLQKLDQDVRMTLER